MKRSRKGKTLNQEESLITNVFKQKKLRSQPQGNRSKAAEGEEEESEEKAGGGGFFACYLLTSLSPRHKGHTYIGFTVNPRRRIRQHNGEIGSGAWRTKRRRPWEMVLCIYGFPTNVSALQFEWAWQHPLESIAVRQAAGAFKSLSGVANKIKLAYTMLTLPPWSTFNITINYFSTKYTTHSAARPTLPNHIKVRTCPMDNLPCYTTQDQEQPPSLDLQYTDDDDDDDDVEQTRRLGGGMSDFVSSSSPPLINNAEEIHTSVDLDDDNHFVEQTRWLGGGMSDFVGLSSPPLINNAEEIRKTVDVDVDVDDDNHFVEQTRWLGGGMNDFFDSSSPPLISKAEEVHRSVEMNSPLPERRKLIGEEIDVVDLLTPSPNCADTKRSRVSPEIIDLTFT